MGMGKERRWGGKGLGMEMEKGKEWRRDGGGDGGG